MVIEWRIDGKSLQEVIDHDSVGRRWSWFCGSAVIMILWVGGDHYSVGRRVLDYIVLILEIITISVN